LGGNAVLGDPQGKALETLKRIVRVANNKPELEILNDEGRALYSQIN